MLDEVVGEGADQPNREHLGAEGAVEKRATAEPRAVGDAELAVAVNGGGTHEVADIGGSCPCRLAATGKAVGDVGEKPDGLVGAA